ncbi:hypothetical protein BGE01nite_37370 [Brevifollis gellanilyticus]|uniref:PEP-utilising enzyme mobile domain-containing protein n=2 Tax=Brevifollis gellanilyticus TaxID=748831 RepID=A0A512MCJ7_9BACT|nr:hypothetical protein BGE01nite_37370 [Brevifollis gellanilyticus]
MPSNLQAFDSEQLKEVFAQAEKVRDGVFTARDKYFWSGWIAIAALQTILKLIKGDKWGETYSGLIANADLPTMKMRRELDLLREMLVSSAPQDLVKNLHEHENDTISFPNESIRVHFEEFLSKYGSRTFDMIPMPTSKAWYDHPVHVAKAIHAPVDNGREKPARNSPQQLPRNALTRLVWLLVPKVKEMVVERDTVIRAYEDATVPLRAVMNEVGRRLKERGALSVASDVKFLEPSEAFAALMANTQGSLSELQAAIMKRQFARPATIHNWRLPVKLQTQAKGKGFAILTGLPASPGMASGKAVIVMDDSDFEKVKEGDVLVCVASNPSWTTLFGRASAVVADLGGPLSHASIVAREFGIPAVLNTKCGTSTLVEGEVYVVDGTRGIIMNTHSQS